MMTALVRLVPALVLLSLVAVAVEWRRRRRDGRRAPWVPLALASLLFLSTSAPVAWLANASLECWYPSSPRPEGDAGAIVVLAGAVFQPRAWRPVAYLGRDTYERCRHAAWLHKSWRALPVIASGGRTDALDPHSSLARAMGEYLEFEGVPGEKIWLEEDSRDTWENAERSAEMLRARGIESVVLVSSGYHMLRAERCFRAQGLEVIAAPCGLRAAAFEGGFEAWIPSYHALASNERVVHEWIGLLWYALRGRS